MFLCGFWVNSWLVGLCLRHDLCIFIATRFQSLLKSPIYFFSLCSPLNLVPSFSFLFTKHGLPIPHLPTYFWITSLNTEYSDTIELNHKTRLWTIFSQFLEKEKSKVYHIYIISQFLVEMIKEPIDSSQCFMQVKCIRDCGRDYSLVEMQMHKSWCRHRPTTQELTQNPNNNKIDYSKLMQ